MARCKMKAELLELLARWDQYRENCMDGGRKTDGVQYARWAQAAACYELCGDELREVLGEEPKYQD